MIKRTITGYSAIILIILLNSCIHENIYMDLPNESSSTPASSFSADNILIAGAFSETSASAEEESTEAEKTASVFITEKTEGEDEILALLKAYTPYLSDIAYKDNEWTFKLRGRLFYWSGGRLLPEDNASEFKIFRSYGFYSYPGELPAVNTSPDSAVLDRIKSYTDARKTLPRDNTFLETLYQAKTHKEILEKIRYVNFLGRKIEVHESLVSAFAALNREIYAAAADSSDIKKFIADIRQVGSFNWREIENSKSRSYHSFGIAVDLVPHNIEKKQVYWNWTRVFNDRWYAVPYSQRWMPPMEIIRIFEKYGFVWGGKWLFYDNIHFEYRPEILILSGKKVINL